MKFNWKNIEQEEIDKLPQLDRIELRQKRDFIIENKLSFPVNYFMNLMLVFIGFLILFSLMYFNIFEKLPDIFYTIPLLMQIVILTTILLLLFNFILAHKNNEQLNKMYSNYFKQEAKKRK